MATTPSKPKLIIIVGPTASGKSDLAIKIAQRFSGEIIAADSRTIYKDMDIGTAKPSPVQLKKATHWGLDLVEPGDKFSAYDFKNYAKAKIQEISQRGNMPIIVGGTGLYIDSLVFDFEFQPPAQISQRAKLEKMSTPELQTLIGHRSLKQPTNFQNRRHLIRTIETGGKTSKKGSDGLQDALIVGLLPDDQTLRQAINRRSEQMFSLGVLKETKELKRRYGEAALNVSGGIVYKFCLKLLGGEIELETAKVLSQTAEWQYARRQRTWFKRNPNIHWFKSSDKALAFISEALSHKVD